MQNKEIVMNPSVYYYYYKNARGEKYVQNEYSVGDLERKFLVQYENQNGSRFFRLFDSYEHYKTYLNTVPHIPAYAEVILPNVTQCFRLDIDMNYSEYKFPDETREEFSSRCENAVRDICDKCLDVFSSLWFGTLWQEPVVCPSHRSIKQSYHIIFPDVVLSCAKDVKDLFHYVKKQLKGNRLYDAIDKSIYTENGLRMFRNVLACKANDPDSTKLLPKGRLEHETIIWKRGAVPLRLPEELIRKHKIKHAKISKDVNYNVVRTLVMEGLPECYAESYNLWFKVALILSRTGDEYKLLWHEFSKRSKKYSKEICDMKWEHAMATETSSDECVTLGSLYYVVKKHNPSLYEKIQFIHPNVVYKHLTSDECDIKKLVCSEYSGKVFTTDYSGDAYMWDDKEKLWILTGKDSMIVTVQDYLKSKVEWVKLHLLRKLENAGSRASKRGTLKTDNIKNKLKILTTVSKHVVSISLSAKIWRAIRPKVPIYTPKAQLNSVPHLLPIRAGKIVDLRTGYVRDRNITDLFCYASPAGIGDPNNENVTKFIMDIMNNNEKRAGSLQRFLGCCLNGESGSRTIGIFNGRGSNGKSKLLGLMNRILGDYYKPAAREVLFESTSKGSGSASPHLMALKGSRVACYVESNKNDKINSAQLKALSGGDNIASRNLFESQSSFVATCTIILATNHLPEIDFSDQGLIDRLSLFEFESRFVRGPTKDNEREVDEGLVNTLANENLDDLLAWIVEGSKLYYSEGLIDCKDDLAQLIVKSDYVGMFISERCELDKNASVPSSKLFEAYREWRVDNMEAPEFTSSTTFTPEMESRGFTKRRTKSCNMLSGIRLKEFTLEEASKRS